MEQRGRVVAVCTNPQKGPKQVQKEVRVSRWGFVGDFDSGPERASEMEQDQNHAPDASRHIVIVSKELIDAATSSIKWGMVAPGELGEHLLVEGLNFAQNLLGRLLLVGPRTYLAVKDRVSFGIGYREDPSGYAGICHDCGVLCRVIDGVGSTITSGDQVILVARQHDE